MNMKIWINITRDDGEILERIALPVDPPEPDATLPPDVELAKFIIKTIESQFDVEDDE